MRPTLTALSKTWIQRFSSLPETKKRIISGALAASVLILVLFFGGGFGLHFFVLVLTLLCAREFADLVFSLSDQQEKKAVFLGTCWLMSLLHMMASRLEYEMTLVMFIGLGLYFLLSAQKHTNRLKEHLQEFAFALMGMIYIVYSLGLMLQLGRLGSSVVYSQVGYLLFFLVIIWSTDTGAYFAGRKWGKHKLYPEISPGKTWEGSGGGLLLSVVLALLMKLIVYTSFPWFGTLISALVVSSFSQIGDLFESWIKRSFGVKDSGSFLPGHGGALDRFDGLIFSLPLIYFCSRVLLNF